MLEVLILAAGEGKRMNSARPKVLQPVGGQPMLAHLIETTRSLKPSAIRIVVGAGADQVQAAFAGQDLDWVIQHQRLGTGHAAATALPAIHPEARVLILPGDMPLVGAQTLRQVVDADADLTLLSFIAADPTGYGRILRDGEQVIAIREQHDASPDEQSIDECNSGVMCANRSRLADWLGRVDADNAQGEYYLTDCVALAIVDGRRVQCVVSADADEVLGANDRHQLATLEATWQTRARHRLLDAGVTLPDPPSVQIRGQVDCGRDVVIDCGVILIGEVRLGDGVSIGAHCVLENCDLAAGTRVEPHCVLTGVRTTGACSIGPFARLRPGTELAREVKIGNFVEVKKATFAAGAKASHLSYIGDASVGAGANLGAGTITCNYDGVNKHRTEIGAGAFVGSNSALVAPVEIGEQATIGAGSVISRNAPAGELTVARGRQRTISGWRRPEPNKPSGQD